MQSENPTLYSEKKSRNDWFLKIGANVSQERVHFPEMDLLASFGFFTFQVPAKYLGILEIPQRIFQCLRNLFLVLGRTTVGQCAGNHCCTGFDPFFSSGIGFVRGGHLANF